MFFKHFEEAKSHYIEEKADIATANISKVTSVTHTKQSIWINSTTNRRKYVYFWGELFL